MLFFLKSDSLSRVDLSTDKIIPKDCIIRVSRKILSRLSKKKLLDLHGNPKSILNYEKKKNFFKNQFIVMTELG